MMERPPHFTGNLPPSEDSGFTPKQGAFSSSSSPDSSMFATMPATSAPLDDPNLGSASLAVLGLRYEILGEAGRGAMGQVYKARDRETGEIVALKLVKSEIASDQATLERFKSELLLARRITHKNVCRVYEFNRAQGIAYTSMEFVEGESLRSVLKRFGSLTQRKGVELALQMCSGLEEAHAQGIVHRDLKPENVMIDAQGNLKIMDFGIARSMEGMSQLTGGMLGTPAYMAPEQAAGKPVDYRTDIYALGLMLYEMFTGTQAFHADNAIALALKQLNEAPTPPSAIEPSVSAQMETVILKCIEKDPARRFQSVLELDTALRPQFDSPAGASIAASSTSRGSGVGQRTMQAIETSAQPVDSRASEKKSRWAAAVVVLAVAAVLAVVAGVVARRGSPPTQATENAAPPVDKSAPAPVATAPALAVAVDKEPISPPESKNAAAKPAPALPLKAKKTETHPSELAARAAPIQPAVESRPQPAAAVQVTPSAAISTPSSSAAAPAATPPVAAQEGSAGASRDASAAQAENKPSYVWVGRFQREVGAQNAARKIENLGLSVTIIPRRKVGEDGNFFVVLTGPFPPAKLDGIVQDLKANGFAAAHRNKPGAPAQNSASGTTPAP
jgi:serine/threonine protein kinase